MPFPNPLPPKQCQFVYVVCTPLSLRLSLYKSDACGHDRKQPPGMTVEPGSLSQFRP
jgi:hypothetical protein